MTYAPQTWQDEILAGEEKYTIKNNAGAVLYDDVSIELKTSVTQAGSDVSADRMNHIEQGIKTVEEAIPSGEIEVYDMLSPLRLSEISITGTETATIGRMHVCSGSSNYTVTLPPTSGNAGKLIGFRFTNTGITTLDGNGSETIDGLTARTFLVGQSVFLLCDGSNWLSINQKSADRSCFKTIDLFNKISTTVTTVTANQKYCFFETQSTPSNGDWVEVGVWMNAGTYTCAILGITGASSGKMDWTLNGVSQTTGQDWYAASGAYNVIKTFSLTVPYTGYHVLKGTVNGKNASSTNYYWILTSVLIYPSTY